jgi:hypothetical protein
LNFTGDVPQINETSGLYEIENEELVQGVANGSNIQLNIHHTISPLIDVYETQANVRDFFYRHKIPSKLISN